MNENSDYLIPISDVRFPRTWEIWSLQITHELECDTDKFNTNYLNAFNFDVFMPAVPLENELPKRIYQTLHKMRSTALEVAWVGYDPVYAPLCKVKVILDAFVKKRKKSDYEIYCTSAFALTNSINNELLDYQIPKLNILCISFNGNKEFLLD
jgi:hypothetical protein